MSTITTRAGKGSPLTHSELDGNFTNLNADKLEKSSNLSDVPNKPSALTNLGAVPSAEKGVANGVASLDSGGKVPSGQLPAMNYIPTSEKAAANGVATLDSGGKIPVGQMPNSGGQMLGAAATKCLSYNSQTIDEDLTVAAGTNAFAAGPVTINTGRTVTVSDGCVLTII